MRELTALASHVTSVATHHILGRQDRRGLLRHNGKAITQDLSSRKRPAASALLLVADWVHQPWPICVGIERSWDCIVPDCGIYAVIQGLVEELPILVELCAQDLASIIEGEAMEKVAASSRPSGAFDRVEHIDEGGVVHLSFAIDRLSRGRRSASQKAQSSRELHVVTQQATTNCNPQVN
jgi:hypothetical protein